MPASSLTPSQLAQMIDSTFLKPYGTEADMVKHCAEARRYGFVMVAVHPAEVARCVQFLKGCPVRVGAAIGFPLGQNTSKIKLFETQDAIQRGAGEIDMVINIRALQSGDTPVVRSEIAGMVQICQARGAISKVILETCYLTDAQKRLVCRIALEEGADFVKTSTGFGAGGATVEDIRLMRSAVGKKMGVKASGGIRDLKTALAMIEAGATRLGTSSGAAIVDELIKFEPQRHQEHQG
jgi:deoxyribose-phosphate aldolase